MLLRSCCAIVAYFAVGELVAVAAEPSKAFQEFAKQQALAMRASDQAPKSIEEWNLRQAKLRQDLLKAWGGFGRSGQSDAPLEPKIIGEIQRVGYRIQKVIFQTLPGVWMTANAYVPDRPGKLPAILHVHGHWKGAKQDPVVQSRCIGCVKHGFFVLCVDAFGAGERGIDKPLGEYHGEMTAATLLPVGIPLSGLQVYENKRAVDYLISRPEVDPDRIGITGASGGGNQSMYAGAMDQRLRCVVPTCSVGTYQSYLSAACCVCELVPGGLKITEEGDILGLVANRGLMVTSATEDAFQFSVGEAKKSVAHAAEISKLFPGAEVRHTIINSGHAYNQQMREAMYGWMTRNLKQQGDGSPLPDPEIQTEEPESLRCYPGETRPDTFVTIPRYAAAEANKLAVARRASGDVVTNDSTRSQRRAVLIEVLGGMPPAAALQLLPEIDTGKDSQLMTFQTEPGLEMVARRDLPPGPMRLAIMIDVDQGSDNVWGSDVAQTLRRDGWSIVAPELRATGRYANPRDRINNAIDHNTAEWAIWIGRPMLGQWVYDVRRTLDALSQLDPVKPSEVLVVGRGSSGLVALCAAAIDDRITHVRTIGSLTSYVTDRPYRNIRMGAIVPAILKDFGDVSDVAALVAPRHLTMEGGTDGAGGPQSVEVITNLFHSARQSFDAYRVADRLVIQSLP